MNSPIKLFIVEGEDRDYRYINSICSCFFGKDRFQSKIINLPASQNIYMLYKLLEADEFETDIVEILRENVDLAKEKLFGIERQDIDEVYLFFDYDIHQNNISKNKYGVDANTILEMMLETFDNETENGKLYISYPMVEAVYDFKESMCEAFSSCFHDISDLNNYKELSGKENPNASVHFGFNEWRLALNSFVLRLKCLYSLDEITFDYYRIIVTPLSIYGKQCEVRDKKDSVFVLSGLPEFILDYFKIDFWNANIKNKRTKFDMCELR